MQNLPFAILSACTFPIALSGQVQNMTIGIHDGVGEDTYVASGTTTQNNNYSTIPSLTIYGWTNGGQLGVKRAFLDFDLGLIPEPSVLVSARLSLYYNPDDAIESTDVHSGENDWVIQRVVEPWNPEAITWNTQPTVTNTNEVLIPATASGDENFEDIDVTAMVQDMLSTSSSGFRLSMVTEQPYRMLILASAEDDDPALRPRLEIEYLSTVGLSEETGRSAWQVSWTGPEMLYVRGAGPGPIGARVSAVDPTGRVITTAGFRQAGVLLDASNWANGPYTVLLEHRGARSVRRIVKSY